MSCRWRETASSVIFTDEKQHRKHHTVLLTLFLNSCKWCRETKNILFLQLWGTPTRDHVVDWQHPDRQPEESLLINSLYLGLEIRGCTWHIFARVCSEGKHFYTVRGTFLAGSEISRRDGMVANDNELTYTMNQLSITPSTLIVVIAMKQRWMHPKRTNAYWHTNLRYAMDTRCKILFICVHSVPEVNMLLSCSTLMLIQAFVSFTWNWPSRRALISLLFLSFTGKSCCSMNIMLWWRWHFAQRAVWAGKYQLLSFTSAIRPCCTEHLKQTE